MSEFIEEIRRITNEAYLARRRKVVRKERKSIKKKIRCAARKGINRVTIGHLFKENIKWLKREGFSMTVLKAESLLYDKTYKIEW